MGINQNPPLTAFRQQKVGSQMNGLFLTWEQNKENRYVGTWKPQVLQTGIGLKEGSTRWVFIYRRKPGQMKGPLWMAEGEMHWAVITSKGLSEKAEQSQREPAWTDMKIQNQARNRERYLFWSPLRKGSLAAHPSGPSCMSVHWTAMIFRAGERKRPSMLFISFSSWRCD